MAKIDIFEEAKKVDLVSYLYTHYDIDVSSRKLTHCPFCGPNKTPSFGKAKRFEAVKCFKCMDKAINIIDFVMQKNNLSNVEAAQKICHDMGLIIEDGLSDEERAKRQKELEAKRKAVQKARIAKQKEQDAQLKKQRDATLKKFSLDLPKLLQGAKSKEAKKQINKLFNVTDKFKAWMIDYVGYSIEHESICIINQDREKNEIYNIKYREKYIWDKEAKKLSDKRYDGKWIGGYLCENRPFPMEYFRTHQDPRVVLSFGEKDALNLLSLDINTLTLGGIQQSFEPYAELLKGKNVFIFPDNQLIEYEAAIKTYKILRAYAKEVFIVSFFHINRSFPKKYDISDFILSEAIGSKDEFFCKIKFASFKLYDGFIDEVLSFFPKDKNISSRLKSYYVNKKEIDFKKISQEILNKTPKIRSTLDEQIRNIELCLNHITKNPNIKLLIKDIEEAKETEGLAHLLKSTLKQQKSLFDTFKKQHVADIAIAFIESGNINSHPISSYKKSLYVWTGKYHLRIDDKELKVFIMQKWMKRVKVPIKQQTADVVNKLIGDIFLRANNLDAVKQNQKYRVISFLNGTAYIYPDGTFTFTAKHNLQDASVNMLDFDFNPQAKSHKWQSFLNDILPTKKEQDALMEFIGYCFLPSHGFQKFLFMLGGGANGKSVVLNVIRKFFGKSTSNLDLQQLAGHELVGIEGKYINIGSEIKANLTDNGQLENLKKMVAGEPVQIDPKNATPYDVQGQEIPKMIFSGNNKISGNIDNGIFRRNLMINFNQTIEEEFQIKELEKRFDDEMSGIFNLALVGLKRLIRQGKFSMSEEMISSLKEYKEEVNPVLAYSNEVIRVDEDCMVSKKLLYLHYKAWAEEKGHNQMSERTFFTRIRSIFKNIAFEQPVYKAKYSEFIGTRPRFIVGLKVLSEDIKVIMHNKLEIVVSEMNVNKNLKVPLDFLYDESA